MRALAKRAGGGERKSVALTWPKRATNNLYQGDPDDTYNSTMMGTYHKAGTCSMYYLDTMWRQHRSMGAAGMTTDMEYPQMSTIKGRTADMKYVSLKIHLTNQLYSTPVGPDATDKLRIAPGYQMDPNPFYVQPNFGRTPFTSLCLGLPPDDKQVNVMPAHMEVKYRVIVFETKLPREDAFKRGLGSVTRAQNAALDSAPGSVTDQVYTRGYTFADLDEAERIINVGDIEAFAEDLSIPNTSRVTSVVLGGAVTGNHKHNYLAPYSTGPTHNTVLNPEVKPQETSGTVVEKGYFANIQGPEVFVDRVPFGPRKAMDSCVDSIDYFEHGDDSFDPRKLKLKKHKVRRVFYDKVIDCTGATVPGSRKRRARTNTAPDDLPAGTTVGYTEEIQMPGMQQYKEVDIPVRIPKAALKPIKFFDRRDADKYPTVYDQEELDLSQSQAGYRPYLPIGSAEVNRFSGGTLPNGAGLPATPQGTNPAGLIDQRPTHYLVPALFNCQGKSSREAFRAGGDARSGQDPQSAEVPDDPLIAFDYRPMNNRFKVAIIPFFVSKFDGKVTSATEFYQRSQTPLTAGSVDIPLDLIPLSGDFDIKQRVYSNADSKFLYSTVTCHQVAMDT
jgi:hypothetical protein